MSENVFNMTKNSQTDWKRCREIRFHSHARYLHFELTCVCSYVSLKQPGSGERLSTEFAHTGQGVRPDVHFESSQADVLLLTVFTAEGLFTAPITLELPVFGQTREAQVLFLTVQTLKVPPAAAAAAAAGRDGREEGEDRKRGREQALSPPEVSCDMMDFQVHCCTGLVWFVCVCEARSVRFRGVTWK